MDVRKYYTFSWLVFTLKTIFQMKWLMAGVICVTAAAAVIASPAPIRLMDGATPNEGRVEVYHHEIWGTVCDDGWTNAQCRIVCRQLNMTGGVLYKDAGPGQGPIWLDDVTCDGFENYLSECQSSNWASHNCGHAEDVGCSCKVDLSEGFCNASQHRILPFSEAVPGVGRVEIQDNEGSWWTICDDYWDDMGAAVLCDCLGYTDRGHFRAYWSSDDFHLPYTLPIKYEAVFCGEAQVGSTMNLWDCPHQLAESSSQCSSEKEAAAVACQPIPKMEVPDAPTVNAWCDHDNMTVCFAHNFSLSAQYLSLTPECSVFKAYAYNTSEGVCYNIPMDECTPTLSMSDPRAKHYCYDVSYSQYDKDPFILLVDVVWTRRACCSISKNGTVDAMFTPLAPQTNEVFSTGAGTNFSMVCYNDSLFRSQVEYPWKVQRGDSMYCKVGAHTWDKRLTLVVPTCKFSADNGAGAPSYIFHDDKCPLTNKLELSYFHFNNLQWGVRFAVPKFQGYDSLYLSCEAYVCDQMQDMKPYCDRSCLEGRSRRSVDQHWTALNHVQEHFLVKDSGFGPLVLSDGRLVNIPLPGEKIQKEGTYTTANVPATAPSQPQLCAFMWLLICLRLL